MPKVTKTHTPKVTAEPFALPSADDIDGFCRRYGLATGDLAILLEAAPRTASALRSDADTQYKKSSVYRVMARLVWMLERHPDSLRALVRAKGLRPRWSGKKAREWTLAAAERGLPRSWVDVPAPQQSAVLSFLDDAFARYQADALEAIDDTDRDSRLMLAAAFAAASRLLDWSAAAPPPVSVAAPAPAVEPEG